MSEESAFRNPDWLRDAARAVLEFYYPECIDDERGGYVAQFHEETGEIYDPDPKHLVATCRFVANFAVGDRLGLADWCRDAARHGVRFLREGHRDPAAGGYDWLLDGAEPVDRTRSCYGHAFVLLAYARAAAIGLPDAEEYLAEAYALLDDRFWEPDHGLYRSQLAPDWSEVEDYRGQNENMHACEALLAAYETTGEGRYLDRATTVARRLTVDPAERTDGLLWEHYEPDWTHDVDYESDDPTFRPWGYQPGHHAEWAKLLAGLARHRDDDWLLDRAGDLFEVAVGDGWDGEYGGFYYTIDGDGEPVADDKYGWPVAEAIGAAAALHERTGDGRYLDWYRRLWAYAQLHLVTPDGNWYTKLSRDNERIPTDEGPAVEPGYHPIGACTEAIRAGLDDVE